MLPHGHNKLECTITNVANDVDNETSQKKYLLSHVVIMLECPKMAANDIAWEGFVVPTMLIGLQECVTSLVADIDIHEIE